MNEIDRLTHQTQQHSKGYMDKTKDKRENGT